MKNLKALFLGMVTVAGLAIVMQTADPAQALEIDANDQTELTNLYVSNQARGLKILSSKVSLFNSEKVDFSALSHQFQLKLETLYNIVRKEIEDHNLGKIGAMVKQFGEESLSLVGLDWKKDQANEANALKECLALAKRIQKHHLFAGKLEKAVQNFEQKVQDLVVILADDNLKYDEEKIETKIEQAHWVELGQICSRVLFI